MSWRDIVKAKELTPKQRKLDNNHNGVIDAQDFHIMNGSKNEMEKLAYGAREQCPTCGNMFPNMRALDMHESQKHPNVAKSPSKKHYTRDGKEWNGKTHKMPNGNLMSEDPHSEKSVRLYHKEELSSSKRSAFTR